MSLYIISYDLINQKNYPKLSSAIEGYQIWCRPLLSVWVIKTSDNATKIRDNLLNHMDADDKLLILKIAAPTEGATYNLSAEVIDWLKTVK